MKQLTLRKKIIISLLTISGAATIAICLVMNFALIPRIEAGASMRCFDMCATGYTIEQARTFVSTLPADNMRIYTQVQLPLDFVYPICYTAFFCLLWVVLHGKANWFLLAPAALAATDYVENSLVLTMLKNPDFAGGIARAASWATTIKTILMYLIILVLVIAIVVCILRAVRRRRARQAAPDSPTAE